MSHSMHYQGRMITSTQIKYISEQIYDLKNKYLVISTFVVKNLWIKNKDFLCSWLIFLLQYCPDAVLIPCKVYV